MGRIINPETAGKERQRLMRSLALAVRELTAQQEINPKTLDLAAFLVLALEQVNTTIEVSVGPWEKRGYWIKADRFRLEWLWAGELASGLREALSTENWSQVALLTARVAEKLGSVKVPKRHRIGTPWMGAWDHIQQHKAGNS